MTEFWGKYRGIVWDNNDPDKIGRIKARVPSLEIDDDEPFIIPWALPSFPLGGKPDIGALLVPEEDSMVWLEFEDGDLEKPIYTGTWFAKPDIGSQVPFVSKDGDDETTRNKGFDIAILENGKDLDTGDGLPTSGAEAGENENLNLLEPRSNLNSSYPNNRSYKSPSGHLIEIDDTPEAERIHIYHRTGAYFELHADGSIIEKAVARKFLIATGDIWNHAGANKYDVVDGIHAETIRKLKHQVIRGNKTVLIGGRLRTVSLNREDIIRGEYLNKIYGNVDEEIIGSKTINIAGKFGMAVGGGVRFDSCGGEKRLFCWHCESIGKCLFSHRRFWGV